MAKAIEVVPTYRDQAGKTSTNTLYVPNGLTLAQMQEGLGAAAALIDEVTGTVIEGITFCVEADISGITANLTLSTADVEDIGAFQFRTSENRPVNVNVPGIIDTLTPSGSDALDQSNVDVAAWISAFEDGIVTAGGTIQPTDVDEDDITAVVFAREEVRNSGSRS